MIHIVESLARGAVENWLLRMLAHGRAAGKRLDWTFFSVGGPGSLDDKARGLGAEVIHSSLPLTRKAPFIRALRGVLQQGGFDVLHCHHDLMSAPYLIAAAGLPIARRIIHVHNADQQVPTPNRFKQMLAREPFRRLCFAMAEEIVGISNVALDAFLAGRRRRAGIDVVHHYGIDPRPFIEARADRARFREQLDLPANARILLFFGRIVPEKNPVFAVDVLADMRKQDTNVFGVFAGAGSLEGAVAARARTLGIERSVRLLGWRSDSAEVMGCADLFILPRPVRPPEGFGLAVLEAQLAGLPLLLSEGIADDPLLPTAQYRRLPLSAGASAWAQAGRVLLQQPAPTRAAALEALSRSPFDMDFALRDLLRLYDGRPA